MTTGSKAVRVRKKSGLILLEQIRMRDKARLVKKAALETIWHCASDQIAALTIEIHAASVTRANLRLPTCTT